MANPERILVTGGGGFIGSSLVKELASRGHEVIALDLDNRDREDYVRCDVRAFRQLERLVEPRRFDSVYHLAAEYGRWNGEDYYENLWQTNAIGTKNMIRLQERLKFRLIFFSSAEVYGDYRGVMKEDVMDAIPIKQLNDYAITKWAGELMCLNSAEQFGTETVRAGLAYPWQPTYAPSCGMDGLEPTARAPLREEDQRKSPTEMETSLTLWIASTAPRRTSRRER